MTVDRSNKRKRGANKVPKSSYSNAQVIGHMEIQWNKKGIISNCSRVISTVWLQHIEFYEGPGEKVWMELCKDAMYCFE